jgi:hypothetical protein
MDPEHTLADISTYLIESKIVGLGSHIFYRSEDNSLTYDPRQTIGEVAQGKEKVALLTQIRHAGSGKGEKCCVIY